jgi:hypothetical protein
VNRGLNTAVGASQVFGVATGLKFWLTAVGVSAFKALNTSTPTVVRVRPNRRILANLKSSALMRGR